MMAPDEVYAAAPVRIPALTLQNVPIRHILVLIGVGITSILAHLVPMLIGRGVAPAQAALAMSLLDPGLVFGRILSGWLMDHSCRRRSPSIHRHRSPS